MVPPMQTFASTYGLIASENDRFPAFVSERGDISHGHLWRLACTIASAMGKDGVNEKSLVCLHGDDLPLVMATLLATSLRGAALVAGNTPMARVLRARTTHHYRTPEAKARPKFTAIDETWLNRGEPGNEPSWRNPRAGLQCNWLYLGTSGTTGRPKTFCLTQDLVLKRSLARERDFPYQQTVLATPAPVMSRMFWARALATLLQAGAIADSYSVSFWARSGVNLVAGSPVQVYDFFQKYPAPRKFRRAEVGGAKIAEEVIATLLDNVDLVVDSYGAAETNKSFENEIRRGPDGSVSVRGVRLDSEVEIIADNGAPCGAGELGTVRVRNPYLIPGYLDDAEATARYFKEGWFYPGDVATWGANKELVIIGRSDDVINLGGYKLNAGLLDMFLSRVPGIKEAIAFQNPKSNAVSKVLVLAVFEAGTQPYEVMEAASQQMRQGLGVVVSPSAFRAVTAIPRDSDGDPDRKACQAMVMKYVEQAGEADGDD